MVLGAWCIFGFEPSPRSSPSSSSVHHIQQSLRYPLLRAQHFKTSCKAGFLRGKVPRWCAQAPVDRRRRNSHSNSELEGVLPRRRSQPNVGSTAQPAPSSATRHDWAISLQSVSTVAANQASLQDHSKKCESDTTMEGKGRERDQWKKERECV